MNPIDNPNEDTEFNDILRKHGVLPPKPAAAPSRSPTPPLTLEEGLAGKSLKDLGALAEDEADSDTERYISSYRRQRLAEFRQQNKRARFGDLLPIGKDDYSSEVTEASKLEGSNPERKGEGTGVVVVLFCDGDPDCVALLCQLRKLARLYPETKFVSIPGTRCIEGYPDRLQPTLILYRGGEVVAQVVSWGKDRKREAPELEALLVVSKVVYTTEKVVEDNGDKSDDDLEDDPHHGGPRRTGIRSGGDDRHRPTSADDDSDFDL